LRKAFALIKKARISKMEQNFFKNSLIYWMSLGSRELFHSNVWAWLIEQDHDFIKIFFKDYDKEEYVFSDVLREWKHRDIVIRLQKKGCDEKNGKYFYVIENKIKSLQDKQQLSNYTEDLDGYKLLSGAFAGIIHNALEENVLSLKNKSDEFNYITWHFIDYLEIAEQIRLYAKNSQNPIIKLHLAQIDEYCDIVAHMHEILSEELNKVQNVLNYGCSEYLKEIRLQDVFVKLKGSDFFHYVCEKKELQNLCPKGFREKFHQSFHNGKATLDFFFTNWQEGCSDYLTIGIQIEGSQYRYIVKRGEKFSGEDLFNKYKGIWFDDNFDNSKNERFIFGKRTSLKSKRKFDKYGVENEKDLFIYQYYNIDESNWRYDDIFAAIKGDLAKIGRDIIGTIS